MAFIPIETRIQALSLAAWGIPSKDIAAYLGLPQRTVQDIYNRAKARGFDPTQDPRIKMEFVEDAKRSGRPRITEEVEHSVLQSVNKDGAGREKSLKALANELGISRSSVLRILKRHGYVMAKSFGLIPSADATKAKHRKFCLDPKAFFHLEYVNIRKRKCIDLVAESGAGVCSLSL